MLIAVRIAVLAFSKAATAMRRRKVTAIARNGRASSICGHTGAEIIRLPTQIDTACHCRQTLIEGLTDDR